MSRSSIEVLVVVLAGGEGSRLFPLTETRTKPAVPIGGKFRLIDIPLSNACHSWFRKILVLTQGKDRSLNRHLKNAWISDVKSESFINILSPQGMGTIYKGDADAVRQIIDDISYYRPDYVLIVPGDHLVKMQYYNFIRFLVENDGDAALSVISQPMERASSFGSLAMDFGKTITEFREKDPETPLRASTPDRFYASMGIYAFKTSVLLDILGLDGMLFGKHLIPQILSRYKVLGYDYEEMNQIPERVIQHVNGRMQETEIPSSPDSTYWRDVGTIGEYFDANMDLVATIPRFNLYGREWPFYTVNPNLGPAKIINPNRQGFVESSIVCEGCILSDVQGRSLVISPSVHIEKSTLDQVIIFNDAIVDGCTLKRTIIDKHANISNLHIGFDDKEDAALGIYIDPVSGIRVVPKHFTNR
ncbi:MAG: hypothetical protein JXB03_01770 [Spirochaetales bacterium]|nr:hypothetical protein [Spirochaetales bacterium]